MKTPSASAAAKRGRSAGSSRTARPARAAERSNELQWVDAEPTLAVSDGRPALPPHQHVRPVPPGAAGLRVIGGVYVAAPDHQRARSAARGGQQVRNLVRVELAIRI